MNFSYCLKAKVFSAFAERQNKGMTSLHAQKKPEKANTKTTASVANAEVIS